MKKIFTKNAPAAIGPYSHAIQSGNLVFCSGQTPLNPQTMIIKTSVFLKNFADFEKMNKAHEAFFGAHKPARTTVEVSRLPKDALVEIECVAEKS